MEDGNGSKEFDSLGMRFGENIPFTFHVLVLFPSGCVYERSWPVDSGVVS